MKELTAESVALTKKQDAGIISLSKQAADLVITGEGGLKEASQIMKDSNKYILEIESLFKVATAEAFQKHKNFKNKWNEYKAGPDKTIAAAKAKVAEWYDKQRIEAERIRKEQELDRQRREDEQRRKEEEAIKKAAELQKKGKAKQAEKVLQKAAEAEPEPEPEPAPAPPPKVSGMSTSTKWKARITNMSLFCKAVAEDRNLEMYIDPNFSMLNKVADRMKKANIGIPGVVAVSETSVTSRK